MADKQQAVGPVNAVMMPWFMGGPWVPKFGGNEREAKFSEWKTVIEAFVRAQGLSVAQRVDFVLSALESDAKREVLLLPQGDRDTDINIFAALTTLYDGHQSVAQLRANFLKSRQGAEEGVGAFTLRLRELHHRWRAKEAAGAAGDDEILRAQFAMGLRPGPVQQELQRQLRRTLGMTFTAACTEAKALERELTSDDREAWTCRTYTATSR